MGGQKETATRPMTGQVADAWLELTHPADMEPPFRTMHRSVSPWALITEGTSGVKDRRPLVSLN
jgi:hypothetical protein